ncbi:MAG: tRNA-dihydrouridine synthase family protein [Planctomycetes bacterium]|nr:tRNA-dihydrouridine synthase family protein [Planctomycetota bacterium]
MTKLLKFGNLELDVPFFQAPLSGYTDRAMRVLAKEFGSPLSFTGVLLDKIALHAGAVRKLGLAPLDDEHPVGAQILGADPIKMTSAAAHFEKIGFDMIDLNFACPAPKVLRRGRGGAMLNDPDTIREIFRRVRDCVKYPVTMKLRIGHGNGSENREKFWQICENAVEDGCDGLVIHGRTVLERYRGESNWQILAEVKRKFPQMTIVGSGDMFEAATIVKRLNESGIDGVLIARGAIGNPWLFTELRAIFEGKDDYQPPTLAEQGKVILRHYEMIAERLYGIKGIRYFRKFAVGYCKRHPERKKAQMAIISVRNRDQVYAVVREWFGVE